MIDAQGRRVGKSVNGTLEDQYIWGGALRVVAERRNGQLASRFSYGNSLTTPDLVVRLGGAAADRVYRVISDQLGSPIYIVNIADPADVWLDASYDEWGNITSFQLDGVDQGTSRGGWPIPQGFAGGLYDPDTGLVRFGVRDYDPRVGRWTAKDPILFEGGQGNLYVYVSDDPINAIDPRGLFVVTGPLSGDFSTGIQALRGAWTSIQTTVGLLVGVLGSGFNAQVIGGNLEFYNNGIVGGVGTAATTFGNVIVYGVPPTDSLRAHEVQHIPQSNVLGPAYLPLHILNQGIYEGMLGWPHSQTPLECGPSDQSNRRPWP